jgi:hypothetical protein
MPMLYRKSRKTAERVSDSDFENGYMYSVMRVHPSRELVYVFNPVYVKIDGKSILRTNEETAAYINPRFCNIEGKVFEAGPYTVLETYMPNSGWYNMYGKYVYLKRRIGSGVKSFSLRDRGSHSMVVGNVYGEMSTSNFTKKDMKALLSEKQEFLSIENAVDYINRTGYVAAISQDLAIQRNSTKEFRIYYKDEVIFSCSDISLFTPDFIPKILSWEASKESQKLIIKEVLNDYLKPVQDVLPFDDVFYDDFGNEETIQEIIL